MIMFKLIFIILVVDLFILPSSVAEHKWYYQGNQGWWQYDDRTNNDVEEAYKDEKEFVKVMISGFIYIIDFQRMVGKVFIFNETCNLIE